MDAIVDAIRGGKIPAQTLAKWRNLVKQHCEGRSHAHPLAQQEKVKRKVGRPRKVQFAQPTSASQENVVKMLEQQMLAKRMADQMIDKKKEKKKVLKMMQANAPAPAVAHTPASSLSTAPLPIFMASPMASPVSSPPLSSVSSASSPSFSSLSLPSSKASKPHPLSALFPMSDSSSTSTWGKSGSKSKDSQVILSAPKILSYQDELKSKEKELKKQAKQRGKSFAEKQAREEELRALQEEEAELKKLYKEAKKQEKLESKAKTKQLQKETKDVEFLFNNSKNTDDAFNALLEQHGEDYFDLMNEELRLAEERAKASAKPKKSENKFRANPKPDEEKEVKEKEPEIPESGMGVTKKKRKPSLYNEFIRDGMATLKSQGCEMSHKEKMKYLAEHWTKHKSELGGEVM